MDNLIATRRRTMSRALLQAANRRRTPADLSVGAVLAGLGDRSFAWAILLFSLVNMIPAPPGSALVTGLPLLVITLQMARGAPHVRLPALIAGRAAPRDAVRALVIRLRPLLRPIERVVRTRRPELFTPRNERLVGALLFAMSLALMLPIPGVSTLLAFALLVSAIGLLERDWLVTSAGLTVGAAGVVVALTVLVAIEHRVEAMIHH